MTPDQFRRLALALPDAIEGAHGGHPDFRVGGKVFASLGAPDASLGMVKLTPDQQAMLTQTMSGTLIPVPGAWGLKGYTNVRLANASSTTLKPVLALAYGNCAPKAKRAATPVAKRKRAPNSAAPSAAQTATRVTKAIKASKLPGIEEGTHYGYPSMKAGGKFMMRIKDADTLVFSCPLEEKAMLMEAAPDIYFETDHYKGWPAVLARVSAIGDAELAHRIRKAWEFVTPKKLIAELKSPAITKASKRAKKR